jgi:hypothetical protein
VVEEHNLDLVLDLLWLEKMVLEVVVPAVLDLVEIRVAMAVMALSSSHILHKYSKTIRWLFVLSTTR